MSHPEPIRAYAVAAFVAVLAVLFAAGAGAGQLLDPRRAVESNRTKRTRP